MQLVVLNEESTQVAAASEQTKPQLDKIET